MYMKKYKHVFVCGLLILSLFLLMDVVAKVEAQANPPNQLLRGWAWSSNIGWISFSCKDAGVCMQSNYQVKVDSTGNLTGYGWSSNIGWISFNQSDLSGCPSTGGVCSARIVSNKLEGWGRFITAQGRLDGWDGWIHLGPASYSAVLTTTPAVDGFAWGSTVVGWANLRGLYLENEEVVTEVDTPSIGDIRFACSNGNPQINIELMSDQAESTAIQYAIKRYIKQGSTLILQGTHTSYNPVPPDKLVFVNIPVIQGNEYVFVAEATHGTLYSSATSTPVTYLGVPDCTTEVDPVEADVELEFNLRPDITDARGYCKANWSATVIPSGRETDLQCSLKRGNSNISNGRTANQLDVIAGRYNLECNLLAADGSVEKTKIITRVCTRNPKVNEI
ncbi:MAG: hypothetical protein RIQ72_683 [Candidatus Parcubacteria bacterium]|jgi:hypothetical protein